jgi:hypothetical protein
MNDDLRSRSGEGEPPSGRHEPPPFDPDPRLVAYLEGGSKAGAESRFRAYLEKLARKVDD